MVSPWRPARLTSESRRGDGGDPTLPVCARRASRGVPRGSHSALVGSCYLLCKEGNGGSAKSDEPLGLPVGSQVPGFLPTSRPRAAFSSSDELVQSPGGLQAGDLSTTALLPCRTRARGALRRGALLLALFLMQRLKCTCRISSWSLGWALVPGVGPAVLHPGPGHTGPL